jgi:hypothetical protein
VRQFVHIGIGERVKWNQNRMQNHAVAFVEGKTVKRKRGASSLAFKQLEQ